MSEPMLFAELATPEQAEMFAPETVRDEKPRRVNVNRNRIGRALEDAFDGKETNAYTAGLYAGMMELCSIIGLTVELVPCGRGYIHLVK